MRPVTCSETGDLLRMLLAVDDGSVSSHSLKSTCLSWAAKAGMPRESRRLLGRHADAVQSADSFYSRDLIIGPLRELQCVIRWVREGLFHPDNNRAEYSPSSPVSPGVKQEPIATARVEEVIEIESDDTESSTSTSNPEDASSGDDEALASEVFEPVGDSLWADQERHALVRHGKSKIIHTIPSLEPFKSDSR